MKVAISISLNEELINTIDKQKALAKRSTFVEYIILLGLEVHNARKVEDAPKKDRY